MNHELEGLPTPLRNRDDPLISPTELWERVNKQVSLDTQGPGCPVGCVYCNQNFFNRDPESGSRGAPYIYPGVEPGLSVNSRLMIGSDVVMRIPPKTLLKELQASLFYHPATTILFENFNDVAVDFNRTMAVAEGLVETGHAGALAFYTKMGLSKRQVEWLKKLQTSGGKPLVLISYSELPVAVEPIQASKRINTARFLAENGVPVVLSLRPIIKGINDKADSIGRVLTNIARHVNAIAFGGLYVDDEYSIAAFTTAGYPLPQEYAEANFPKLKMIEDNVETTIRKIAGKMGLQVPIFRHTACAIASVMTQQYAQPTPNRKAHWLDERPDCQQYCPAKQLAVCSEQAQQSIGAVTTRAEQALDHLGYDNSKMRLVPSKKTPNKLRIVGGRLTWEELCYVTERCGWRVDNLPSYAGLMYRVAQALQNNLKVSPDKCLGAVLVGEDWYVVIDGDIDGQNNEMTVQWLRSQAQARIQVVDVDLLRRLGVDEYIETSLQNHGLAGEDVERISAEFSRLLSECK